MKIHLHINLTAKAQCVHNPLIIIVYLHILEERNNKIPSFTTTLRETKYGILKSEANTNRYGVPPSLNLVQHVQINRRRYRHVFFSVFSARGHYHINTSLQHSRVNIFGATERGRSRNDPGQLPTQSQQSCCKEVLPWHRR